MNRKLTEFLRRAPAHIRGRRTWVSLGVALGLLVGASCLTRCSSSGPGMASFPVQKREIGLSLIERGILMPLDSVPIDLQASGEIVAVAGSGTRVKKGESILRVDDRQLIENLDEQREALDALLLAKEVNEAEYKLAELEEKNRLRLLAEQIKSARLEEETARAGITASDLRLLEIRKAIAELDLKDAQEELERQSRLQAKGFISRAMLEPCERRLESAREAVVQAGTEIRLRQKGAHPDELLELKQKTDQIQAQLERGAKAMERVLDLASCQIKATEARVARKKSVIRDIEDELRHIDIPAPADGIMSVRLYRDWRIGGSMTEYKPGITKYKHDRIADIVNPGRMSVFLMIHESDIRRIKPGMPARVSVVAYPLSKFDGTLSEVGGIGRDRLDVAPPGFDSDQTGVTMFNASVAFEANNVEFRPGMSAVVEIIIDKPAKRLVVPRNAVRLGPQGDYTVLQKGFFGPREERVIGSPYDSQYFLVEKGLREGDTIMVPPPGKSTL